jgi:hypothetical protein
MQQRELDEIAAYLLRRLHAQIPIDHTIDLVLLLDQVFGDIGLGVKQLGHARLGNLEQKRPRTDFNDL